MRSLPLPVRLFGAFLLWLLSFLSNVSLLVMMTRAPHDHNSLAVIVLFLMIVASNLILFSWLFLTLNTHNNLKAEHETLKTRREANLSEISRMDGSLEQVLIVLIRHVHWLERNHTDTFSVEAKVRLTREVLYIAMRAGWELDRLEAIVDNNSGARDFEAIFLETIREAHATGLLKVHRITSEGLLLPTVEVPLTTAWREEIVDWLTEVDRRLALLTIS